MLDYFLIFSSEMFRQNEPKLGGQYVYKVLYKGSKVTVTPDRDKISILLRGASINASYQVSVHLGTQFQRRRLKRTTHQKE
jgi:hypothetical protein